MNDFINRKIDKDYAEFEEQLRRSEYENAVLELSGKLKQYDNATDISLAKFKQARVFIESYLKVYLSTIDGQEFLHAFAEYMDHPNAEFVAVVFRKLAEKAIGNMDLFESACSIVLQSDRSEVCYILCRSAFVWLSSHEIDYEDRLGPIAKSLRIKIKAMNLIPISDIW